MDPRGRLEDVVGQWRTPTTGSENSTRGNGQTVQGALNRITGGHTLNLQDQVALWQMPSVADTTGGRMARSGDRSNEPLLKGQASALSETWQTPRSHEVGNYQYSRGDKTKPVPTLTGQASSHPDLLTYPVGGISSTERRSLNPLFVEWLMGWPLGWTLVGLTDLGCSETALSHFKRRMRSEFLRLASLQAEAPAQRNLFE